jgi:O-antigen/teichoic acid export membrane protein
MLASMTGLEFTGIYSMAFFIAALIELPRRAISQLTATLFAGYWKNEDFPAMQTLFRQVSINQFLLGSLILLLIWVNLDALFFLMPNGAIYTAGRYVVLIIGLTKVVDLLFGGNHEILLNSPAYRFSLIALVFLGVIAFSINYVMIPPYGMNGAAAGTVVSVLLYNSLKSGFIWVRYRLWAFDRKTLYALGLVAALFVLQSLWPTRHLNSLTELLLVSAAKSLLLLVLYIGCLFRWNLSPEITGTWHKNWPLLRQKLRIWK